MHERNEKYLALVKKDKLYPQMNTDKLRYF